MLCSHKCPSTSAAHHKANPEILQAPNTSHLRSRTIHTRRAVSSGHTALCTHPWHVWPFYKLVWGSYLNSKQPLLSPFPFFSNHSQPEPAELASDDIAAERNACKTPPVLQPCAAALAADPSTSNRLSIKALDLPQVMHIFNWMQRKPILDCAAADYLICG